MAVHPRAKIGTLSALALEVELLDRQMIPVCQQIESEVESRGGDGLPSVDGPARLGPSAAVRKSPWVRMLDVSALYCLSSLEYERAVDPQRVGLERELEAGADAGGEPAASGSGSSSARLKIEKRAAGGRPVHRHVRAGA